MATDDSSVTSLPNGGEAANELAEFQRRVEEAAREPGFEAENRAFLTHITPGRIRDSKHGRKLVQAARERDADQWTLYRRETKPQGAVYTNLMPMEV